MKVICNVKVGFHYLNAPPTSDFYQNLEGVPALALCWVTKDRTARKQ